MRDIPTLFLVEYSLTQNATHIRTLRAVLANNRRNVLTGMPSDYLPIGMFLTRADADQFKINFQPTLDEQAQFEFKSRNWRHIAEVLIKLLPKDLNSTLDEE